MKDFRELQVWHKAHQLVLVVYKGTACFPPAERFGLTGQLRKSAVSKPSNIAEGCGRQGDRDFSRFIQIAIGSTAELEYQLLLARDLELLDEGAHQELAAQAIEVKKMLTSLVKKLRASKKRYTQPPVFPGFQVPALGLFF